MTNPTMDRLERMIRSTVWWQIRRFFLYANQDLYLGIFGRICSIICFCTAASIILVIGFLINFVVIHEAIFGNSLPLLQFLMVMAAWLIIPILILCLRQLWRLGLRFGSLNSEAALREDPRPPVLYLRRFAADQDAHISTDSEFTQKRIEERETRFLRYLGPVLALAKPGEWLPHLGATRIRYADEKWRTEILELMRKSKLIVFQAGLSDGLVWEIKEAFKLKPFKPILLCISREEDSVLTKQQRYAFVRRVLANEFHATISTLASALGNASYYLFLTPTEIIESTTRGPYEFPPSILDYISPGVSQLAKRKEKQLRTLKRRCLVAGILIGIIVNFLFLSRL